MKNVKVGKSLLHFVSGSWRLKRIFLLGKLCSALSPPKRKMENKK